ncbi:MAG TPA: HypC/HybG/HupF family hydrogenase formation chaperone [Bryobacteraceae bacterium]|nr:HypC/HybG/HupF family hydrogenase formation chaperone [Bryobacteraceae bacterium]
MCLAVPGKVLNVEDGDPAFRTGNVDFCGVRKTVNLASHRRSSLEILCWSMSVSRFHGLMKNQAARTYRYLRQIGSLQDEGLAPEERQGGMP